MPTMRKAGRSSIAVLVLVAGGCASRALPEPLHESPTFVPIVADAPSPGIGLLPPTAFPGVLLPEEGRELPPVEVTALRVSEEEPVGVNGQPDWTTQRRFARSRVYVLAPGQWETEVWYRGKYDNGHDSGKLVQTELGVGLPHRLQVDYYQNFIDADGAGLVDDGPQFEARWALADWGRIPLNPTIYGEYKWRYSEADKVEAKLLLGDTLAPRWHAASNLIWEQETSGGRETELAVSGALSYSLLDGVLGIGAEATAARRTAAGSRGHPVHEYAAGPSLQWRFSRNGHVDVVPMMGLDKDAHDLDLFVVVGWDFGGGGPYTPTSTKSR